MIQSSLARMWKLLAPWRVLLAAVGVSAALILALIGAERSSSRAIAVKYAPRPKTDEHVWKKMLGTNRIIRPSTVRPDLAGLPENASVIGVVVDGKARAYALRSLRHLRQHVVNDLVGGVPITVAHCDVSGCTQVYSSHERSEPLDVSQAGFRDGQMILGIGDAYYQHSSGEPIEPRPGTALFPYNAYPWIQTTWKEWKQLHPETDVYVEELK